MSTDGHFAFASINGVFALVQVSRATPISALSTVDIKVFRHEFINIFRFMECRTLHPMDFSIIEHIDDDFTRYEEDNETVFLARDVMEHMRKLLDPRKNIGQTVDRMARRSTAIPRNKSA